MIVFLETLGCSRNQVDSEIMLGKLVAKGHKLTDDPSNAEVIIVNTCGFISTASDEAVDVILQMAEFKETGTCNKLIATGCLAQRYKDDESLVSTLPEVDAFLGTAACEQIVDAVETNEVKTLTLFPDPNSRSFQDVTEQRKLLTEHLAYIKVSEGCNRKCTYCIIPSLRGIQRSRPIEDICQEATSLVKSGVKEIILTAENTTDYGQDFKDGVGFQDVLSALSDTLTKAGADKNQSNKNNFQKSKINIAQTWIRFLYTHPKTLSEQMIQTVKKYENICSYYDLPIQHASSDVLKKMGRPYTHSDLTELVKRIRKIDPTAALRTTLIVGFPGETEEDFQTVLTFIKEIKFDHLGVFTYSDSGDLKSHEFKDHVPAEVAEKRQDLIMAAQAEISKSINEKHVGKVLEVLIEENPEEGVFIGRTKFQAPDVDGVTFIYSDGLEIGSLVNVRITDAYEYDIAGELA
jgi:ribosomal protein S12 methylthiotransferase